VLFKQRQNETKTERVDGGISSTVAKGKGTTRKPWDLFTEISGVIQANLLDTQPLEWACIELEFRKVKDRAGPEYRYLLNGDTTAHPLSAKEIPELLGLACELAPATAHDGAIADELGTSWQRCLLTYASDSGGLSMKIA
jgi:hypothetical protein